MNETHLYLIIAVLAGLCIYQVYRFIRRKIIWVMATLPMLATMGGAKLPPGKLQHLLALFT